MPVIFNTTIPLEDIPTPLIFFPPQLVYQINVATYLQVASTAVLIWDILDNLSGDFKLLFSYTLKLPTILYFISRITLLTFCLGRAVLMTLPLDNCERFEKMLVAFLVVFLSTTTTLFYLRVCAVYRMSKFIIITFGILWLSTIGMAVAVAFARTFSAIHIGPTQYCIEIITGNLLGPTAIVLLVHDSSVYFAISYRIYQMFLNEDSSMKDRASLIFLGTSLPALSKTILLDGQLYFLVVVLTKVFLAIATFAFDAPGNGMYIVCLTVIVNILSCRVYRNLKMNGTTDVITIQPASKVIASGMQFKAASTVATRDTYGNRTAPIVLSRFESLTPSKESGYEGNKAPASHSSSTEDIERGGYALGRAEKTEI